jgi:hypothetical protein
MRWTYLLLLSACGRVAFAPQGDGAVTGDGPGDADGSGDGPAAACAGFDECEDFEGAIDPPWIIDASVTLDTTIAHRGLRSARMHMNALAVGEAFSARMQQPVSPSTTSGETWVRAWFRMSAAPTSSNALELISYDHTGGGVAGDYVFSRNNAVQIYNLPSGGQDDHLGAAPLDTWFCIVFHVTWAETATGSLEMLGDLTPALQLTNVTTNSSTSPIDALGIGPYFGSPNVTVAQPAFDVWVDDVIVHASPVTCAD